MAERPTRAALRAVAERLTTSAAEGVLDAALDRVGCELLDWSVRSVHRRGDTSLAVVFRVELVDRRGRERDRLYVVHASRRTVPGGAVRLTVDTVPVHVWAFPHDPYLPGLPDAVSSSSATALLGRTGSPRAGHVAIRTRSYRPTRRAVVELRPTLDDPPAAYVKLLGGRRPDRVRERASGLVAVHRELGAAGVPVPLVLEADVDVGRVVLEAVPGHTLRHLLRTGAVPPTPEQLLAVVTRLQRVPELTTGGDPDGFADVTRHVALLGDRLPHRTADLRTLATAAAAVAGPVGTVHGDLHDGQVVVAGGGEVAGLLDVDGAGTGHVAHDLGRLLAGLDASRTASTGAAAVRATAYLEAVTHEATAVCPAPDLARATAAAWVGLATGPIRVASPTWRRESEERLDRALAWVRWAD